MVTPDFDIDLGVDYLDVLGIVGQGGFATVYEANDTRFDRRVAVKVLSKTSSEKDRERFNRECRIMGRLSQHRNVVTVYDNGYTPDGRPYIVMELVRGGSLADLARRSGPMSWQQAVGFIIPIAEALADAHTVGVLHRDIKPENILLQDDRSLLSDFGIAQLNDSTARNSTHITASWLHTAPETFNNTRDERSDLYSLASTLYELIAGQPPFWVEGEDSMNPLFMRLMSQPAPHLPAGTGPPSLDGLLQRALAKDPAERPGNASEFAAGLRQILDSGGAVAPVAGGAGGATAMAPSPPPQFSVSGPPPGAPPPPANSGPPQFAPPTNSGPTQFVPPHNSQPPQYPPHTNSGPPQFVPPHNSGPAQFAPPQNSQPPQYPPHTNSGPPQYAPPQNSQPPQYPPHTNSGPPQYAPQGLTGPTPGRPPQMASHPGGFQHHPGAPYQAPGSASKSGGSSTRTILLVALATVAIGLLGTIALVALAGGDETAGPNPTNDPTPTFLGSTTTSESPTESPSSSLETAPPIDAPSSEPVTIDVFDLTVGHCFVDSVLSDGETASVDTVDVVPCEVEHLYEVYHAFDIPGDAYPGTAAIEEAWLDGCLAQFETFVGKDYATSTLDFAAFFPSEESWDFFDDRLVLCSIIAFDELPRTGTAEGSGL